MTMMEMLRPDPRTKDWMLMGSPMSITAIIAAYLCFVFYFGPRFIKNRAAYSLKTFLQWYNIFQIIGNAHLAYGFIQVGLFRTTSFYCEPMNFSTEGPPYKFVTRMWWLMIMKIIDLSETMVFALRKKNNQISFLHTYHHTTTIVVLRP